jgi:hypothetical protein
MAQTTIEGIFAWAADGRRLMTPCADTQLTKYQLFAL